MNRLIAILIAACYLCASTGFRLREHYCMGERIGASIFDQGDTHKCARCGMEKKSSKKGCCHDEYKVVKSKGSAAIVKAAPNQPVGTADLPVQVSPAAARQAFAINAVEDTPGRPNGPPRIAGLRLHIRNCVFLI